MFDTFLRVGSSCDLITPTIALFQDIRNGPSVQFSVPYDTGWSAVQIKEMLEAVGISVWGLMVKEEAVTFTVRKAQARYAAYWLERKGLPCESSLANDGDVERRPRTISAKREPVAPKAASRGNAMDNLLDGMADFVDTF